MPPRDDFYDSFIDKRQDIEVDKLFRACVRLDGSDLHLKVGSPPMYRVDGDLRPVDMPPLRPEVTEKAFLEMAPARKQEIFETYGTVDFAY